MDARLIIKAHQPVGFLIMGENAFFTTETQRSTEDTEECRDEPRGMGDYRI
jgi:hypothetical protein